MADTKITVSIVGASGYAGGELLRLLLRHPNVEVKQATSRRFARFPVTIAHPNLRGATSLKFSKLEDLEECDVLYLALPNGESQKHINRLRPLAKKIIDLGADYRLMKHGTYEKWYGEHTAPELISQFVSGIAEVNDNRERLREADLIACAGCEATCSILTLYPLYKSGVVDMERTVIDAKLGSSAAGGEASLSSHHPERAGVVRSYKPTMHRHTPEIEQALSIAAGETAKVHVSATAIEMVRGIVVTAHVFLKEDLSDAELRKIYLDAYRDEPFIRVLFEKQGIYRFPEPKLLEGTNYCDIAFEKDRRSNRVVVVGAIDNLGKGTAGQGVQALNIAYNLPETTGLEYLGLHPI